MQIIRCSRHISVELRLFTCTTCKAVFEAELLLHIEVAVFLEHLKHLRCPKCGAGYAGLTFYEEPPATEGVVRDVVGGQTV